LNETYHAAALNRFFRFHITLQIIIWTSESQKNPSRKLQENHTLEGENLQYRILGKDRLWRIINAMGILHGRLYKEMVQNCGWRDAKLNRVALTTFIPRVSALV